MTFSVYYMIQRNVPRHPPKEEKSRISSFGGDALFVGPFPISAAHGIRVSLLPHRSAECRRSEAEINAAALCRKSSIV